MIETSHIVSVMLGNDHKVIKTNHMPKRNFKLPMSPGKRLSSYIAFYFDYHPEALYKNINCESNKTRETT